MTLKIVFTFIILKRKPEKKKAKKGLCYGPNAEKRYEHFYAHTQTIQGIWAVCVSFNVLTNKHTEKKSCVFILFFLAAADTFHQQHG